MQSDEKVFIDGPNWLVLHIRVVDGSTRLLVMNDDSLIENAPGQVESQSENVLHWAAPVRATRLRIIQDDGR